MGQSGPSLSKAAITTGKCSICGGSAVLAFRPFCSRRCSDVDLSRWLRGAYAIPGGQADADEDGDDSRPLGDRGQIHGSDPTQRERDHADE